MDHRVVSSRARRVTELAKAPVNGQPFLNTLLTYLLNLLQAENFLRS